MTILTNPIFLKKKSEKQLRSLENQKLETFYLSPYTQPMPTTTELKKINQTATRVMIHGPHVVQMIEAITGWLMIGYQPVWMRPDPNTYQHSKALPTAHQMALNYPVLSWEPITKDDIPRLTLLIKTNMALLDKVLPSLKAVEVTETAEREALPPEEMANRVRSIVYQAKRNPQAMETLAKLDS